MGEERDSVESNPTVVICDEVLTGQVMEVVTCQAYNLFSERFQSSAVHLSRASRFTPLLSAGSNTLPRQ